jgi:hypothetical protein
MISTKSPIVYHLYKEFNIINNGIEDKRYENIIRKKHIYKNTIKISREYYNDHEEIFIWYIYNDKYFVDIWYCDVDDEDENFAISLIIELPLQIFYNEQTPFYIRKRVLENDKQIKMIWSS